MLYYTVAMFAMASVTIGVGFFIGQLFPSAIPLPGSEPSSSAPDSTPPPFDTRTVSSDTDVQSDSSSGPVVQVGVVTALPPPPSAEAIATASVVTCTSATSAQAQIDALIEGQTADTDPENTVDETLVVQPLRGNLLKKNNLFSQVGKFCLSLVWTEESFPI